MNSTGSPGVGLSSVRGSMWACQFLGGGDGEMEEEEEEDEAQLYLDCLSMVDNLSVCPSPLVITLVLFTNRAATTAIPLHRRSYITHCLRTSF